MKGTCPLCIPNAAGEKRALELIAGLCPMHYWNQLKKKSTKAPMKRRGMARTRWPIKKPVVLKSYHTDILRLPDWYLYQIEQGVCLCENCGDTIAMFSEHALISAQAHIVPKNLFPSVAIHPENVLHLCSQYNVNNCHGKYDRSWSNAEKMTVFNTAMERFQFFSFEIHQDEIRKLPAIFKDMLCPTE